MSNATRTRRCDQGRRRFLQSVSGGVLGFSAAQMLQLESQAAVARAAAKAKNVLVVYEEGGISQMDTWDPKPEAPTDRRSPYKPIATKVPGIQYTSLMPRIAQHADKLAVVRSMTSAKVAGHKQGCQEFFKGYTFNSPIDFPDIGSVVSHVMGSECPSLPGYIFAPGANMPNHITTPGFLPRSRTAWKLGTKSLGENVAEPGWNVRSLEPQSGLDAARMGRRRAMLSQLQNASGFNADAGRLMDHYREKAFDLLTSPEVHSAFDLSHESDKTRDRYGRDHRGCCYLLGRKLIEAGVRFVSVTVIQPPELVGRPGIGKPGGVFLNWDHHEGIYKNGPCSGPQGNKNQERYGLPHPIMMPSVDQSFSALLEDMQQRGLLDETLVCFVTEMGRTPHVNKWQGRDHWGRAMSIAFAGAGVPGGQTIGATNRDAGDVVDRRYTPYDYAETIYRKLGIDTDQRLMMPDGRRIDFSQGGRQISEIF